VIFLTGHRAKSGEDHRWGKLPHDATLVIYMPGTDYQHLAKQLAAAGIAPETSCIVISSVSTPREQSLHTTVRELAQAAPLPAPCVVLVGAALA
jgi:uroporphyrin-III C-methyltransferase